MEGSTKELARTDLYIGGAARRTADVVQIADPARGGEVVGVAASATEQDVTDAIEAARSAFPAWASMSAAERAQVMAEAIEGVDADREIDARVLSREVGKIHRESAGDAANFEVRWRVALRLADEIDAVTMLQPEPGIAMSTEIEYQPLGTVTIIVPFNSPLSILALALPHALLAGNTVIVKPAPSAPLATTRVVQRVAEKLPAGVLNVITGGDDVMSRRSTHGDRVCFTGSVDGGRRIMGIAAQSLTRVTLELGGNDPAVLLRDAPLDDEHLDRLFTAIWDTTGQICMSAKRVYVHRSRLAELVDGLEKRLRDVRLGDGLDADTTMGPLHQPSQKVIVDEMVQEAKRSGAEVREYGEIPGGELATGNFVRPALVLDPDPALRIVTEEQFGPVIPILPFDDEDHAIAAANDTWAGLGASVWTRDAAAALRVARRLRSGYLWVNDHGKMRLDPRAPFGGIKDSGFGREQGIQGVRAFQEPRTYTLPEGDPIAATPA